MSTRPNRAREPKKKVARDSSGKPSGKAEGAKARTKDGSDARSPETATFSRSGKNKDASKANDGRNKAGSADTKHSAYVPASSRNPQGSASQSQKQRQRLDSTHGGGLWCFGRSPAAKRPKPVSRASSDVLRQIKASTPRAVSDFRAIVADIDLLSRTTAVQAGNTKPLSDSFHSSTSSPFVNCPPSRFTTAQTYCFFAVLSVVSTELVDSLNRNPPSPPLVSAPSPAPSKGNVNRQRNLSSANAAKPDESGRKEIWVKTTTTRILTKLQHSPDHSIQLTPKAQLGLNRIVSSAYTWAQSKLDLHEFDLQPFAYPPKSNWNSLRMEAFEMEGRGAINKSEIVISPVAMGLEAKTTDHNGEHTYVQVKCKVLLNAWFSSSGNS